MNNDKTTSFLSELDAKDNVISTSTKPLNQNSNNDPLRKEKSGSVYLEDEGIASCKIIASIKRYSEILQKQVPQDLEVAEFQIEIKSNSVYTWNVYHEIRDIPDNIKEIYDELHKDNFPFSAELKNTFYALRQYTVDDVKTNLNLIKDTYASWFTNERIWRSTAWKTFFCISKISFNRYNSGKKPMEGFARKKADPRCCRRIFGCFCKCIECLMFKQWNSRWIVLKDNMIYYMNSSNCDIGKNIYWFDDGIQIRKQEDNCIQITNWSRSLTLQFYSYLDVELWYTAITDRIAKYKSVIRSNKYQAYTNKTSYNLAHWFSDGELYFKDLHQKLLAAKENVFITDWWLSPEVFLVRPVETTPYMALEYKKQNAKENEPYSRLMDVLNAIANRGVEVYILIYCECSLALTLNSKHSKDKLKVLHKNIKVTRHPKDAFDWLWSHHEKWVVIDQRICYVGGLDWCWGRFDTNGHPWWEPQNNNERYMFPGIDYSNARVSDFINVNNYLTESADRKTTCRMPWHDVHIRLEGPAAIDVARHFVERWNFARFEDRKYSITNVKEASHNTKGKSVHGGWLGQIIAETNRKEEEEKKNNDLIAEDKKEGDSGDGKTKALKKINYSAIIKKRKEASANPDPNNMMNPLTEVNTNTNTNDNQNYYTTLQSNYWKNKTIVDDDHLMRPQGAPQAYHNFVKNYSQQKKKSSWFSFNETNEKVLTAKVPLGLFKAGTRSIVQVLRSGSKWSVGVTKTENSILQAYYHWIDTAKHYIYIENQFFVSKAWTDEEQAQCPVPTSSWVENEIAYHIRTRVQRAYEKKEKFHIFVFIPLLPGFAGEPEESGTLQIILKHTIEGISHNNGLSIIEKLAEIMPYEEISQYISFYSLRTHDVLNGKPITELIYIHSKWMIIDDRKILIGSANINDRSMLGTRDSEFAVIVKEEKKQKSKMNGQEYVAAKFATTFRRAWMGEHLGIDPQDPILEDPWSEQFLNLIQTRAKRNTQYYRELFGCYPDDTYTTFKEWRERKMNNTPEEIEELKKNYAIQKSGIRGHIVEFPKDFLYKEKLGINFFSVENLVPEKNFT